MQLEHPLRISARLLPAIQIGTAWLSYDYKDSGDFYLDVDGKTHIIGDYTPGPSHTLPMCFDDILAHFGAEADAMVYGLATGRVSEFEDLFDPEVANWCYANRHLIEEAQLEMATCLN